MPKKPLVAVTRVIPQAGMDLINEHCEVRLWERELPPSPEELADLLHGVVGALTLLTDQINGAVLDREPQLRVISNFAVGYDNVNVPEATERGVIVCNTPGVLTETTAEFAFALLISAARRVVEGVDYVRAGKWQTWGPTLLMGQDVAGATLGIVGFGRIGQELAKLASGFNMTILAYDTYHNEQAAVATGASYVDLDDLLRRSDFVSIHVALTDQTHHLIGAEQLQAMKPTAVLINAARGPVVDTDALVTALKDGEIFAAALDVTEPEPLPADHPLVSLPNAIVVPHIASASVSTRNRMAALAANNLLDGLNGERPAGLVNAEVFDRARR